jgi:hypothetical protein
MHRSLRPSAGSLGYLEKRCTQMRYVAFRAQGYPVGSGIVESAHQTAVHARRRSAGLLRARAHVLLSVWGLEGTDRWADVWPVLTTRLRARQVARARRRRLAPLSGLPPLPVPAPPWRPLHHGGPARAVPPPIVLRTACRLGGHVLRNHPLNRDVHSMAAHFLHAMAAQRYRHNWNNVLQGETNGGEGEDARNGSIAPSHRADRGAARHLVRVGERLRRERNEGTAARAWLGNDQSYLAILRPDEAGRDASQ